MKAKLPQLVTIKVTDKQLVADIRRYRKETGTFITRIGEDALRLFFKKGVRK
jgi:hypothetical protein